MKPSVLSAKMETYVFQPNRITEAHYNYTLIQERVLNAVIYRLQEAILKRMKGESYIQLSLFQKSNNSYISLVIPLREIARPSQYKFVKDSVKKLASIVVSIPYKNKDTKENRIRYVGLFRADIPESGKRNSEIIIEIDNSVAKLLVEIDLNEQRKPINYTKYIYEIALKSRNKYTPKIYKLLCSWRKTGQFYISINDLRSFLGIEKKYKFYRDIKKNVLLPVQSELIEKADCWFDCDTNDFEIKDGNNVVGLVFRVYTKSYKEEEQKRKDYIIHILRMHYRFLEQDYIDIQEIFERAPMIDIITKINYLNNYIQAKQTDVDFKKSYMKSSLINEFLKS